VNLLNKTIACFDSAALRLVSKEELEKRDRDLKNEDPNSALGRAIYEAYDSVDTKATAILQHVSIMIAVTGVLYSWTSIALLRLLFGIETLLYVSLAVFCLRLFMVQNHSESLSDTENAVMREALLDITAKLTFFVSVVLIGTVIIELVLR
jgi:hypothetical protein